MSQIIIKPDPSSGYEAIGYPAPESGMIADINANFSELFGGGGGGGTPGGSNGQVQFNAAGSFGGTDLLYFDPVSKALTIGSATNTTPTWVLDANVDFYNGFTLQSYPLFDPSSSDGLGVGFLEILNGQLYDEGALINLVSGSEMSGTINPTGGAITLGAGFGLGPSGGVNGSITIAAASVFPVGLPLAFTLIDGGSGYVDGVYTDLSQRYAFTAEGGEGGVAITQMTVVGGAVTALYGAYLAFGTNVIGDVLTLDVQEGSVYPYAFSGTPATLSVSSVSTSENYQGAFLVNWGATGGIAINPSGAYLAGLLSQVECDSSGNVALGFSSGGALLLGSDPGTATYVVTSNGPGTPPTWQPAGGGGSPTQISQAGGSVAVDSTGNIYIEPASGEVFDLAVNGGNFGYEGDGSFTLASASGAYVSGNAAGELLLIATNAQPMSIQDSAGSSVSLDGTGDVSLIAIGGNMTLNTASGQFILFGAASSVINIDGAGDIAISTGAGALLTLTGTNGSALAIDDIGSISLSDSSGAGISTDGSANVNILAGASASARVTGGGTGYLEADGNGNVLVETDGAGSQFSINGAPVGAVLSRDTITDAGTFSIAITTWIESLRATGPYSLQTVNMPPNPVDQQQITIYCNFGIAALTLATLDGWTIENAPNVLTAGTRIVFLADLSTTTWERMQ